MSPNMGQLLSLPVVQPGKLPSMVGFSLMSKFAITLDHLQRLAEGQIAADRKRGNSRVQFQIVSSVGEMFNETALDVYCLPNVKGAVVWRVNGGINQRIDG